MTAPTTTDFFGTSYLAKPMVDHRIVCGLPPSLAGCDGASSPRPDINPVIVVGDASINAFV